MGPKTRESTKKMASTEGIGAGSLLEKVLPLSPSQTGANRSVYLSPEKDSEDNPIARKSDIKDLRTLIEGLVQSFENHRNYVDQQLTKLSDGLTKMLTNK